MEEEIDLREYIEVLLKHWKWIAGVTILAAAVAFVLSSFSPKVYEASADVIILQSSTTVSLEPKIETGVTDPSRARGYQATWLNLASSTDVAAKVLEQNNHLLSPIAGTITALLKKMGASNDGDVITISIKDQDPEVAAELANSWAATYVDYVNKLYGNDSDLLIAEVQDQADNIEQAYKTAQTNWEQFLGNNQIAALGREINIQQSRVEAFKQAENNILAKEIAVKENQAQTLREEKSQAEGLPLIVYNLKQETIRKTLSQKYNNLVQIDAWLSDGNALRDQLNNTSNSTGANVANALALIVLRSRVLASSVNSPVDLQLAIDDISEESVTLEDIDNLIDVLEERRSRTEAEIANLTAKLLNTEIEVALQPYVGTLDDELAQLNQEVLLLPGTEPAKYETDQLAQTLDELDQEILALEEKVESQKAFKRELQQTRDLTWENFQTVQRKLAELQLEAQITDSQVRPAGIAIIPDKPLSSGRLRNTAIAGALGFMLSVFGVFAWEYWRNNGNAPAEDSEAQTTAAASTS